MIGFEQPLALIILTPVLYLWWRLGRGPREVWALRALAVLLAVVMLASPVFLSGRGSRRIVMLVDRSLSCGKEAMDSAGEFARLVRENLGPEDRLSIVTFGKQAAALARSGHLNELAGGDYEDASDLSAGIALAGSLLAGREGGRVFVISDGLFTGPDPMERVPALHKAGVSVDYSPIARSEAADVAITEVRLPERVQQGHPFEICITVSSPVPVESDFRIRREGVDMHQQVRLLPGDNRFTLRDTAGPAGLIRYTITASVQDDPVPENNTALAVTNAVGPPRVLVLNQGEGPDGMASHPSNVTRALDAASVRVDVGGPGTRVTSADLKPYAAVVLENIPLSSLNDRADAALRNYVRETGGGVLVTGGRRSFAEGGYYQSRLEEALPVSMMRKEQFIRPKVAMCFVLDRSGSMAAPVRGGRTKMDMANRATAEAIGVLMPQDEVAVIAVDSQAHKVVPLTPVEGNVDSVIGDVLTIESMGGGIYVYTGLAAAVNELLNSDAQTRHIALFADAADSEEPRDYKNLVDTWVAAGGTISVVGLGGKGDVDADFLIDIARRGGGEVFFTMDAESLPRIFCQDAIRVARKAFLDRPTGATVSPEIARIGRLGIREFPDIGGYNLCYTREDAAELITTTDENRAPVLAAWQRGLGRVAALTCEADGDYTGDLRRWADYKPFFSSLAKWLQRERDDPSVFASIVRTGRTATVVFEMDEQAAAGCTGAAALIIPPTEEPPLKVPLRWVAPRRMEASFKLDSDGVYHGVVLTHEGRRADLPPVVLPYSPEFEPRSPALGGETLASLAAATGGKRIMHVNELLEAPAGLSDERVHASPLVAALLLLLLLCDITTRKHLWGHLLPAFARAGYARALGGVAAAAGTVRSRLRRRPKAAPPGEEAPPATPEEETPGPEAPPEGPRESVFKRAKRRSRRR